MRSTVLNHPRSIWVRMREERGGRADERRGPSIFEGSPIEIGRHRVEAVRETWLVEDRWWTEQPLRRRYWEVLTSDGGNLVVFHDLISGRWFLQAA